MKPAKATVEGLRQHNRRIVLRALFTGAAATRAELAVHTGLTKPTVSTLISELIDEGLVREGEPGRSTSSGGKRPTLLEFNPDSRQVIGLSVSDAGLLGVLSNLDGVRSALHRVTLAAGEVPTQALLEATASLVAQLDAPLACIGVGLPGSGGAEPAARLAREFGVNVYRGNQAELTALGQLAFAGANGRTGSQGNGESKAGTVVERLVTLLVDDRVEIGVCLASGAVHYGSELTELVAWPNGAAPEGDELALLQLRHAARKGDADALAAIDAVASHLAAPLAWIEATLRPDEVSIGGRLSALGEPLLDALDRRAFDAEGSNGPGAGHAPRLSLAYSAQLGAMGAVALAIQSELGALRP